MHAQTHRLSRFRVIKVMAHSAAVEDLQHRFHVDENVYVVEVCGCGHQSVSPPKPRIVFINYACASESLDNRDGKTANETADGLANHLRRQLPTSVDRDQWAEFTHKILNWVLEHRAYADGLIPRG